MQLTCPGCGAELLPRYRGAEVVACAYCGTFSAVTPDALLLQGKAPLLSKVPTRFAVGQRPVIAGVTYAIVGRARYEYDGGRWEEWLLHGPDGKLCVLQEDEGELVLFTERQDGPRVSLQGARPMGKVAAFGASVFVTEVGEAALVGGEGSFATRVRPGERFSYVDGNAGGRSVIVLSAEDRSVWLAGRPIDDDEVQT